MNQAPTNDESEQTVANPNGQRRLTKKERGRIECLTNRLKHLDARIARRRDAGFAEEKLNFDIREAVALRWVIETITGEPAP